MKKILGFLASLMLFFSAPGWALEMLSTQSMEAPRTYKIEVLQVTDIGPYREALNGFLKTLRDNGIKEGENLIVNRVIIDFDVENGGFWDRLSLLGRIRDEANRVASARPDLALTIGTPATKYARRILELSKIPTVFTAVANPLDAGATSLSDAGTGVTGSTLHIDMANSMKMLKQIFPSVTRIGMVHTDDENGVTHVQAARDSGIPFDVTVTSQQVNKQDNIVPALKVLYNDGRGVQLFAVPLDTYYAMRKFEPTNDLSDFAIERNIPIVAFALTPVPGAVLYVGADFGVVGSLAGKQAIKILKQRKIADTLPILKQEAPSVFLDPKRVEALKVQLPQSILDKKTVRPDGLWEVVAE